MVCVCVCIAIYLYIYLQYLFPFRQSCFRKGVKPFNGQPFVIYPKNPDRKLANLVHGLESETLQIL